MTVTIGLPFFVLASSAPLVQRWLAQSAHRRARDPYFLYAASNAGSKPDRAGRVPGADRAFLGLEAQGRWWTPGYVLLLVLMAACVSFSCGGTRTPRRDRGRAARRRRAGHVAAPRPLAGPRLRALVADARRHHLHHARHRARAAALGAAAGGLPADVRGRVRAAADPSPLIRAARLALPLLAVILVHVVVTGAQRPLWLLTLLPVVVLFAVAGLPRPAGGRPPAASPLTEFYLWVAAGALGGLFNAVVAPVLFDSLAEYPLAIVLACALYPARRSSARRCSSSSALEKATKVLDWVAPVLVGVGVALALEAVQTSDADASVGARAVVFGLALGIVFNFARRPLRFAAAIAAIFLASPAGGTGVDVSSPASGGSSASTRW